MLDQNRDLYITRILQPLIKKLGSMVDTFAWHDEQDLIYTLMDGKSIIWYYPNTIYVDEDIIQLTKWELDGRSLGSNATCVSFEGSNCVVRRSDGALVSVGHISPLPGLLQDFAKKKLWEQAIRLCRAVKKKELWACLAAISVFGQDLNTAEVAYAHIDEVCSYLLLGS